MISQFLIKKMFFLKEFDALFTTVFLFVHFIIVFDTIQTKCKSDWYIQMSNYDSLITYMFFYNIVEKCKQPLTHTHMSLM